MLDTWGAVESSAYRGAEWGGMGTDNDIRNVSNFRSFGQGPDVQGVCRFPGK